MPQVYAMVREGDLAHTGALLSGNNVNISATGGITNNGTILGRKVVSINAQTVNNLGGGLIQGDTVGANARQDINNIGGSISAQSALTVDAGRDLNVQSTTRQTSNDTGRVKTSNQTITRVAGLYVTKADGTLLASAGNDANLIAAAIQSAGNATIAAGNNVNLKTATQSSSFDATIDANNFNRNSQSAEVGTTIQSAGNATITAGNNITARAAQVQARGDLLATAANSVTIEAGQATRSDSSGRTTSGSSFFASSTTTDRTASSSTQALASNLGGNNVTIAGGNDLGVKASSVVADKDLALRAGNNLTIEAGTNTQTQSSYSAKSESGLMGAGDLGVSIGNRDQSTTQQSTSTTAAASTVGSTGGNVTIAAGTQYTQKGSDVLATGQSTGTGNIDITAKKVDIVEARETSSSQTQSKFEQSGITVSLSNPVVSAAQTMQKMDRAANQTSSSRMKALATLTAGLAAYGGYTAIDNGMGSKMNGQENQIATGTDATGKQTSRDSTALDKAGGINISVSLGSSSNQSNSSTASNTARASTVAAGGNVNITALGAGRDSNLRVQGSSIQAGNTTNLSADNAVQLLAAANTVSQTSSNNASSGSVGMGIGTNGWTINASASKAQGNGNGADTTYTNTQVQAGQQVNIQSGADTTLQGAVVRAGTVKANVGGNLNIETLQDQSTYSETQSSLGFSISVPIGAGKAGGSISASNTDINSNYQSAVEQSGIKTGDGGFQVSVQGNTDLKGGFIASSDKAIADNKNSITTDTLTTSDLLNQASASAKTTGFTLSSEMATQGNYGLAKGLIANALDNASQSGGSGGQTKAGISAGNVVITNEAKQLQATGKTSAQTLASLNRDTVNSNTTAQKQDVQAMKQTVEAQRIIKNEAVKQLSTLTDEAYRVMFKETPKFYQVICPAKANCTSNPELATTRLVRGTPQEIQKQLADASAGTVLAVNGIDNPLERAGQLAMQNAELVRDANGIESKPAIMYLMHYVPANNGLSELMIAAYEKSLASTLGYSNQDETYAAAIQARGQSDTTSLGHSRGTIVQTNANDILGEQGFKNPNLSVRGVGGAVAAQVYTEAAIKIAANPDNKNKNITFSYFATDPVPVVAGGNTGVISLAEFWKVLNTSNSAHSCYGTGAAGCSQVELLTPNSPRNAKQDNSNLIRYEGGRRVDASPIAR